LLALLDPGIAGADDGKLGIVPLFPLTSLPATLGADLSLVTAFFKGLPFLISPRRAFLSGVTLGSVEWAGALGGGGIPGGGGGGGGGGGPIGFRW
jgi:uncharacterized membrane protein YgcG